MPSMAEFRPLGGDTIVAPTSYAKTIYRLARTSSGAFNTNPAQGWVTSADERSYVKGQLNDDTTERTYFTFNDSDQPPRAIDARGANRRMGVPAPTQAPAVSVNVVDEYTAEDRDADLSIGALEAAKVIKAYMVPTWVGPEVAGFPASGSTVPNGGANYFGRSAPEFAPADESQMVRLYGLASAGADTTVANSYTALDGSQFSWVFDGALSGFWHNRQAGQTVITNLLESRFFAIPFYGRAVTYKLNRAPFLAAIQALEVAGTKQFNAETAEKLADAVDDVTIGSAIKSVFVDHKNKTSALLALLDGGSNAVYVTQVKEFYAKASVVAEINSAVDNLARAIQGLAVELNTATDWTPVSGDGGGDGGGGDGGAE